MKNKMSIDAEADEIIRRLKAPPSKVKSLDDVMAEYMSEEIQREIDDAILQELLKHGKRTT